MGLRIPAAGGWESRVDSASCEALGLRPTALLLPQSTVPELSYLGIICVFAYIVGHSIGPSEFLHTLMGTFHWGPVSSYTPQQGHSIGPSELLPTSMGDIPWGPVRSCTPRWGANMEQGLERVCTVKFPSAGFCYKPSLASN